MGSCLSCFRGDSYAEEREPLLPKYQSPEPPPTTSSLDKTVDILTALQSGKLPSQDQLNTLLRSTVDSNILTYNAHYLRGTGQLSNNGRRVLEDLRELLESVLQLGLEKNVDDKFQDILYQCSQLDGPPLRVNADTAIEAGQESVAQLQAQAPTSEELAHDATDLVRSLKAVVRLLTLSSTFRLLLADVFTSTRQVLTQIAEDVGSAAQQVQVAAEGFERATNVDGGSFNVLTSNVEGVANDVLKELDDVKHQSKVQETVKDVFVTRTQDFFVRAHKDPRTLGALQNLLAIIRKYIGKISQSVEIISGNQMPENVTSDSSNLISVTPAPETSKALDDLKVLAERLASGQSLDPLLDSLAATISSMAEHASPPDDASAALMRPDIDLQHYLHSVDLWLSRALSSSHPLYATSRSGTRALESIYDGGHILFTSSSASSPPPPWAQNLRTFLGAYNTYTTALTQDRSTMKFTRALSALHIDSGNFAALALGLGTYTGRRARAWKDEAIQDLLGWFLPRIIGMAEKIGIPMPRVEYKSGNIAGALDMLRMGPGQVGGVALDLIPNVLVLRTSNETRINMEEFHSDGARTSSSSRLQLHIDGAKFSIKDLGFFFSYTGGILGYADQGLLSVDAEGFSLDIDISTDVDSDLETSHHSPLFTVLGVRTVLPSVKFKIDQSKHWILNKLFVQPMAGPVVERVVAGILEARIRSGLEKLSEGFAVVKEQAQSIAIETKHPEVAGSDPDPMQEHVEVGIIDYWEALLHKGPEAFGFKSETETETHAYSSTTATMKGVIHTTTTIATDGESEGAPSPHSSPTVVETETSIAVGGGSMLFSDEAGPYHAEEPEASSVLDDVAQGVEETVGNAESALKDTASSAVELRGKIEHAEQRREDRKEVETSRSGWRSRAFDI